MGYKRVVKASAEYAGESYSQTLLKENGLLWTTDDKAIWTIYDGTGPIAGAAGNCTIATDLATLSVLVPATVTTGFIGNYKLLVELQNNLNADISDVIAEYNIAYSPRIA